VIRLLLAALLASSAHAYGLSIGSTRAHGLGARAATTSRRSVARMASTEERIKELVQTNKVMLFMKGTKMFPQCGFSNTAVTILNAVNVPYETFDVLEDNDVREGIKAYSNWPTIPQCYIEGEFIGGCDLLIEMYENGELQARHPPAHRRRGGAHADARARRVGRKCAKRLPPPDLGPTCSPCTPRAPSPGASDRARPRCMLSIQPWALSSTVITLGVLKSRTFVRANRTGTTDRGPRGVPAAACRRLPAPAPSRPSTDVARRRSRSQEFAC